MGGCEEQRTNATKTQQEDQLKLSEDSFEFKV